MSLRSSNTLMNGPPKPACLMRAGIELAVACREVLDLVADPAQPAWA